MFWNIKDEPVAHFISTNQCLGIVLILVVRGPDLYTATVMILKCCAAFSASKLCAYMHQSSSSLAFFFFLYWWLPPPLTLKPPTPDVMSLMP